MSGTRLLDPLTWIEFFTRRSEPDSRQESVLVGAAIAAYSVTMTLTVIGLPITVAQILLVVTR